MRLQSSNRTHIFGGATDGSHDGPPLGVSAESVAGRQAHRRLTPAPALGAYNAIICQRPAASGQRPAASGQRPAASGQRPAASGQRPAASGQRPAA